MTPTGWGKTMGENTDCGETCKRANLCYACSRELGGWQGLTLEDIDDIGVSKDWVYGARWAEAKLREKNT